MNKRTEQKYKWNSAHYDQISLTVEKGKKAIIRNHALSMNESVNAFVNRAIDETISRDLAHPDAPGFNIGAVPGDSE